MPVRGLTIIVATDDPERCHAALSIAAAQAATGAPARVYLHGGAPVLLADLAAPGDDARSAAGLPTLAQLMEECAALGVSIIACQSGLALAGLAAGDIDRHVQIGGLVSLLTTIGDDRLIAL